MSEIRESRVSRIKNKIITLPEIQRLANRVHIEYRTLAEQQEKPSGFHQSISYSVKCSDGSSFASGEPTIFNDDSIINNKRVLSINIRYVAFHLDRTVNLDLTNGSSDYLSNAIEVKGSDSNWVNGTLKSLQDIVNSLKPQNTIAEDFYLVLIILFSLSLGSHRLFSLLLELVPLEPDPNPPQWVMSFKRAFQHLPFLKYLFKYGVNIIIGVTRVCQT